MSPADCSASSTHSSKCSPSNPHSSVVFRRPLRCSPRFPPLGLVRRLPGDLGCLSEASASGQTSDNPYQKRPFVNAPALSGYFDTRLFFVTRYRKCSSLDHLPRVESCPTATCSSRVGSCPSRQSSKTATVVAPAATVIRLLAATQARLSMPGSRIQDGGRHPFGKISHE
jgi:hypothetical protein